MRIVAGKYRGRKLLAPSKDSGIRPTSDRVREAIFALLGDIDGARVLDLYAGSGALGIEAVSRGAEKAVFVDSSPLSRVRANIDRLKLNHSCRFFQADVEDFLKHQEHGSFDLVLIDPPYRLLPELGQMLESLVAPMVSERGRLVVESSSQLSLRMDLPLLKQRRYGRTYITIYGGKGLQSGP